jgi:hypothetical protein
MQAHVSFVPPADIRLVSFRPSNYFLGYDFDKRRLFDLTCDR